MKLIKTIYRNKKEVNKIKIDDDEIVKIELINLLIDKINKRYKINITYNPAFREIKANLYFTREYTEEVVKMNFEYYFYLVDNDINLY